MSQDQKQTSVRAKRTASSALASKCSIASTCVDASASGTALAIRQQEPHLVNGALQAALDDHRRSNLLSALCADALSTQNECTRELLCNVC